VDGEQALFASRREHEQFDLPALNENEVDRLILITGSVNVSVSGNLEGARILRLALQRIA